MQQPVPATELPCQRPLPTIVVHPPPPRSSGAMRRTFSGHRRCLAGLDERAIPASSQRRTRPRAPLEIPRARLSEGSLLKCQSDCCSCGFGRRSPASNPVNRSSSLVIRARNVGTKFQRGVLLYLVRRTVGASSKQPIAPPPWPTKDATLKSPAKKPSVPPPKSCAAPTRAMPRKRRRRRN